MPRPLTIPEIRLLVASVDEFEKGTRLADEFESLSHCGTRLFGKMAGRGAGVYHVSADLADLGKAPCTCPAARTRPFCKHGVGLLVAWAQTPDTFVETDAPPATARKPVKRGRVEAAELLPRGIEQAATLVCELALHGIASVDDERLAQMRLLAEHLRAHQLRRLSARTLELADRLSRPDEVRLSPTHVADALADMHLTVRKLEKYLAGEPLDPRHVEELIGKTWQKKDRRPLAGLELVQYGWVDRTTVDGFSIQESRFLHSASGVHYTEKQILPRALAERRPPKPSYEGRCVVATATAYPGHAPLRLDLETVDARPLDPSVLARLLEHALGGVAPAVAALQEHRRDFFAPPRVPVAIRVGALFADRGELLAVDAAGDGILLGRDEDAEASLAWHLMRCDLCALIGDVALRHGRPLLLPLAVLAWGPEGLSLRPLETGTPLDVETPLEGAAGVLQAVRRDLAAALVDGLVAFGPRVAAPLAARLRNLGLEPAAALLDTPADLDAFVKLHHLLALAALRLAAPTRIGDSGAVKVPALPSVRYGAVPPGEGTHFDAMVNRPILATVVPPDAVLEQVDLLLGSVRWLQANAMALTTMGTAGVDLALAVLRAPAADHLRVTRLAAMAGLVTAGFASDDMVALLDALQREDADACVRWHAGEALLSLCRTVPEPAERLRRAATLAETTRTGLANFVREQARGLQKDGWNAVRRLGACGPAAIPTLRAVAENDENHDVRREAWLALAHAGDARSLPTVWPWLQVPGPAPWASALMNIPRASHPLTHWIQQSAAFDASVRAIAALQDVDAMRALLRLPPSPVVREALQRFSQALLDRLRDAG